MSQDKTTLPFHGKDVTPKQARANAEWMWGKVREVKASGGGAVFLPAGHYDTRRPVRSKAHG